MGYSFDRHETVPDAVARITDEQVEKAVSSLAEAVPSELEEAVHDARKRAKKLRGLVRLVRPGLGDAYGRANTAFRDAGRELSALRDAHATLSTFDDLVAGAGDRLPDGGLGPVRAGLQDLADDATHGDERRERAEGAAELFRAGRRAVRGAGLSGDGWGALAPGLERSYRDGRKALRAARKEGTPAAVHDWRKRAKDAWYHVRLLRPSAPSVLGPLESTLHDLADTLGDAHDLVVIAERLRAEPDRFGGEDAVAAACDLADRRRATLERRAVRLGTRLYAEKPSAYADRLGAYWAVWHDVGAEKPAGGLADLFPPDDDLDDLGMEALRDRAGEAALPARLAPTRARLVGELRAGPRQ